jgi:hypothetical protein
MWRKWLGKKARIIGIDLNPESKKWEKYGFEIYIGDQGDPEFWRKTLNKIKKFDVLLDDGGHQSFQQLVTLTEAVKFSKNKSIIVVEDIIASFMMEFSRHRSNSFLEYAKTSTDILQAKNFHLFGDELPKIKNYQSVELFKNVYSIELFSGMVAFKLDPLIDMKPNFIHNKAPKNSQSDFRWKGKKSALITWPSLFSYKVIKIKGGRSWMSYIIALRRKINFLFFK